MWNQAEGVEVPARGLQPKTDLGNDSKPERIG